MAESKPVKSNALIGVVGSFGFLIVAAIIMFAIGAFLTATVIGALIGIPLMIASFIAPFMFPIGFLFKKSECPSCGNSVNFFSFQKGKDCSSCKKRYLVKGDRIELA